MSILINISRHVNVIDPKRHVEKILFVFLKVFLILYLVFIGFIFLSFAFCFNYIHRIEKPCYSLADSCSSFNVSGDICVTPSSGSIVSKRSLGKAFVKMSAS